MPYVTSCDRADRARARKTKGTKLLIEAPTAERDTLIKSASYEWRLHSSWLSPYAHIFSTQLCEEFLSSQLLLEPQKIVGPLPSVTLEDGVRLFIFNNIDPFILDIAFEFLYTGETNVPARWTCPILFCHGPEGEGGHGLCKDYFEDINQVYFLLWRAGYLLQSIHLQHYAVTRWLRPIINATSASRVLDLDRVLWEIYVKPISIPERDTLGPVVVENIVCNMEEPLFGRRVVMEHFRFVGDRSEFFLKELHRAILRRELQMVLDEEDESGEGVVRGVGMVGVGEWVERKIAETCPSYRQED